MDIQNSLKNAVIWTGNKFKAAYNNDWVRAAGSVALMGVLFTAGYKAGLRALTK